jgi:ABC-type uncharacterized transport system substrate-binding protein
MLSSTIDMRRIGSTGCPTWRPSWSGSRWSLIVSWGTQGVTAIKDATKTIPIVMIAVRDPVGIGLIASLARPGGNVTGVSGYAGLEIVAKQLEVLKETFPEVIE